MRMQKSMKSKIAVQACISLYSAVKLYQMKWIVLVAAFIVITANCEASDDLKTLINDAMNDFHDGKGEAGYSSEDHESYECKLELKDCEDPAIWKRPNGDLEFTCEIVPNTSSVDDVTALLAERIKVIQAELPSSWKAKTFPNAEPYENYFLAFDRKAHLELTISITPYQDQTFDAVLSLTKLFAKTATADSGKDAQMKLKEKGIEFTADKFLQKVSEGDLASVQLFLDAGMNADSKNGEQSSGLILAAQFGFPEIVGLLLDHDANPNSRNQYGTTAIFDAVQSRDLCFFNMGLATDTAPECNQSQFDFFDVVQKLLDADADPNIKDNGGASALFFATRDPEIAELLLSNGADANLKNNQGQTVLMDSDNPEFVKVLLKHNADPQIKDNLGKTAFDYAAQYRSNEVLELLKAAVAQK
jgi:ankyrin repeat protein